MYTKEFTEVGKAVYLCCCANVRLVRVLPPKEEHMKARFLIEAPFEAYLSALEEKWDKPYGKAGLPGISNAKKFFWKERQFKNKAIEVTNKFKLSCQNTH